MSAVGDGPLALLLEEVVGVADAGRFPSLEALLHPGEEALLDLGADGRVAVLQELGDVPVAAEDGMTQHLRHVALKAGHVLAEVVAAHRLGARAELLLGLGLGRLRVGTRPRGQRRHDQSRDLNGQVSFKIEILSV